MPAVISLDNKMELKYRGESAETREHQRTCPVKAVLIKNSLTTDWNLNVDALDEGSVHRPQDMNK
jgi:hypothetical protein